MADEGKGMDGLRRTWGRVKTILAGLSPGTRLVSAAASALFLAGAGLFIVGSLQGALAPVYVGGALGIVGGVILVGLAIVLPRDRAAWAAEVGYAYRVREKTLLYEFLDDRRARQAKRFVIEAMQDGVTHFNDRYKWSGEGECSLSLKSSEATLIRPAELAQLRGVMANLDRWDVYEVVFPVPLRKGEQRVVEVEWDLLDVGKKALPFYSTTIDVPTDRVVMTVRPHKPVEGVKLFIFPLVTSYEPLTALDRQVKGSTSDIRWEIEQPELGYRYLVTWNWR